jgi:hypothetical protein
VSTDIPQGFRVSDSALLPRITDDQLPDCDCGATIRLAEPVTSQCAQVLPCGCYVPKSRFEPRPREATDQEVRSAIREVDPR